MKCIIFIILLLLGTVCFGKQKSIVLMEGVVLYLTEDSIKPSEFKSPPNIIHFDDICIIDNKIIFGTDYELPVTKLSSAYILVDNIKITLDVSCMYDPNINLLSNKSFKTAKVGDKLVITGLFSDGAGVFMAQWIINKNSSIRSIISSNERVFISLFYGVEPQNH
jgi:hypothetical protein